MREFDAKSVFPDNQDSDDVDIKDSDNIKVDLLFKVSGKDDLTKSFNLDSPLGPTTGPTCFERTSGAMHIMSLLQMTIATTLLLAVTSLI